jgi:hypothetical protein
MQNLTKEELDFLKAEAKKIKGLDLLKDLAKKHDSLSPDSEEPEEKKKLLAENTRRKKATSKAIRLVERVDIDIVEEEPKDGTIVSSHTVTASLICKSSDPEDQVFIEVTLGRGVKFFLNYILDKTLQDRLNSYREQAKKKPLFKKSGHLVDQILKTTPKKSNPLDLFSELLEETREALQGESVSTDIQLFSGVNLTASEMKIQDVFSILLYQQSQTEDPNKQGYYTGVKPEHTSSYLGGDRAISPGIELSYYAIAKEFTGKKNPSGKDLENVKEILQALGKKQFLFKYTEEYTYTKGAKKGEKIYKHREGYRPLFYIDPLYLTKTIDGEKIAETFIVNLHPIYRQQIEGKFILQPLDILQQLTLANGSPTIPLATLRLKEYLFSIIAGKPRPYPEHKIGARKLYEKLEPKLMQVPRLAKAKENTTRAIETLVTMEIIDRYELGKNKVGEDQYFFYLNKNYL